MKRGLALIATVLVALSAVSAAGAKSTDTTITGAGRAFVYPLVSQWVQPVGHAFGYNLQYSSVGSGAGIAAITAKQSTSAPRTRLSRRISSRPAATACRSRGRCRRPPSRTTSRVRRTT